MTDDDIEISGGVGFSKLVHVQINRVLENLSNGNLAAAYAACDSLEALMAYYHDDEYKETVDGLEDDWEDVKEEVAGSRQSQQAVSNQIRQQYYSLIRSKLAALVELAGRLELTPQGSPEKKEI